MYIDLIPDKFKPYIMSAQCGTLIPKENLPEELKEEFYRFLKEYEIIEPFTMQHALSSVKKPTLKELWYGQKYYYIPKEIMKHVIATKDMLIKKDNYPKEFLSVFDKYNRKYQVDIKFYRYEGDYLGFTPDFKLNIYQHLLVLLGIKKYYIFYGY